MFKHATLLALTCSLWACVSVPETLQTPATNLVTYENAVMDSTAVGTPARWGGVIADVENLAQHSVIEMVHYPLKASGRPDLRAPSIGRFKAVVEGFIDPLVFKQDRVLSVLGTLAEPTSGMVGEQNYVYPTLEVSGYHLWEDVQDVDISTIRYDHFYRFGHGYGFDIGIPYRRVRYYAPHVEHNRVRIRSGNTQTNEDTIRTVTPPVDNDNNVIPPTVPPPKPRIDERRANQSNPRDSRK
jgi:outer membrane lipoprotein